MTTTKKQYRKPSQKTLELRTAFREMAQALEDELKEGKHTERLAQVKTNAPGLERYSPLNQILVLKQCPHATEVYGYNEWQSRGFQVRSGEKSIGICAPLTKAGKDGEEARVIGFHRASVFDQSQVDPIEQGQKAEQEPEAPTAESVEAE